MRYNDFNLPTDGGTPHMRRVVLAGALIALPLAALATPAQAADGHGATVTLGKDGNADTCFENLSDFDEDTTDFVVVTTPSGVTTLTCHFKDAFPPTTTLKVHGFGCVIRVDSTFVATFDTSFVLTQSGKGTLVCTIKR
jgi:hypothetical protein